jgi:tetratricopeptide (TPR) repeat protein
MKNSRDHKELIRRGLAFHEARRYAAALPYFDRALRRAPDCPVAAFNRASTLHMLGRDKIAYDILLELVEMTPEDLRRRCEDSSPRSLQLDTYMLLFFVVSGLRGACAEALAYADQHLRRRRRGVESVWSVRQVRAEILAMRRRRKTTQTNT